MNSKQLLLENVAGVYQWLDEQINGNDSRREKCSACGTCCNFAKFDHRLYITSPELIFFKEKLGSKPERMDGDACPYNENGKCTVYENRFAGCRIFFCRADADFQNQLSESAVRKFKRMCLVFDIPYRYVDLKQALNESISNICLSDAEQPAAGR